MLTLSVKTIVEVIAYAYRMGSHLTGVKTVSGRELHANDVLRDSTNDASWKVKGLGTGAAAAYQSGIRSLTLVPENDAERLVEGSILTLEE